MSSSWRSSGGLTTRRGEEGRRALLSPRPEPAPRGLGLRPHPAGATQARCALRRPGVAAALSVHADSGFGGAGQAVPSARGGPGLLVLASSTGRKAVPSRGSRRGRATGRGLSADDEIHGPARRGAVASVSGREPEKETRPYERFEVFIERPQQQPIAGGDRGDQAVDDRQGPPLGSPGPAQITAGDPRVEIHWSTPDSSRQVQNDPAPAISPGPVAQLGDDGIDQDRLVAFDQVGQQRPPRWRRRSPKEIDPDGGVHEDVSHRDAHFPRRATPCCPGPCRARQPPPPPCGAAAFQEQATEQVADRRPPRIVARASRRSARPVLCSSGRGRRALSTLTESAASRDGRSRDCWDAVDSGFCRLL